MIRRIWLLSDARNDCFASAVRIGTWKKINGKDVRISPLILEWERGSEIVGDFIWPSFEGDVVALESVFRQLQERFGSIVAWPVDIVPPRWARKKRRLSEDKSFTIWSENLHLVEVKILHHVEIDWDRSCIKTYEEEDGEIIHEILNGENTEVDVDPETFEVTTRRIPRIKGCGVFVKASLLEGHSFFKLKGFPVLNLCTDSVRDFILAKGYTNIDFFEVGELF